MVDRYTFNSAGEESVSDDGGYVTYEDYVYMQTTAHEQNELYIKASMESTKTTLLLGSLHNRIAELEFLRDTACKVMQEFADELGCKPDNEVILQAIDDLKNKVAELEKRRDGLVAENAALKEAMRKLDSWGGIEFYSSAWEFNNNDGYEAAALLDVETPATDAAIAEIGARAVDDFKNKFKSAHPQPFGEVMMKALDEYEKHKDDVPETGMLNAFFILRDSITMLIETREGDDK